MDQSLELGYRGKDPIQNQQCGKSKQYHEGINKHRKNYIHVFTAINTMKNAQLYIYTSNE